MIIDTLPVKTTNAIPRNPFAPLGSLSFKNLTPDAARNLIETTTLQNVRSYGRVFLSNDDSGGLRWRCYVGIKDHLGIFQGNFNAYAFGVEICIERADNILSGTMFWRHSFLKDPEYSLSVKSIVSERCPDDYVLPLVELTKYANVSLDWDTTYAGPGTYEHPYGIFKCHLSCESFSLGTSGTNIPKALIAAMKILHIDWRRFFDVEWNF